MTPNSTHKTKSTALVFLYKRGFYDNYITFIDNKTLILLIMRLRVLWIRRQNTLKKQAVDPLETLHPSNNLHGVISRWLLQ
jgi:hypothetical protein